MIPNNSLPRKRSFTPTAAVEILDPDLVLMLYRLARHRPTEDDMGRRVYGMLIPQCDSGPAALVVSVEGSPTRVVAVVNYEAGVVTTIADGKSHTWTRYSSEPRWKDLVKHLGRWGLDTLTYTGDGRLTWSIPNMSPIYPTPRPRRQRRARRT